MKHFSLPALVIGILVGAAVTGAFALSLPRPPGPSSGCALAPGAECSTAQENGITENGINASASFLRNVQLTNDSFEGGDFVGTDMTNVSFAGDDLQRANFSGSYLSNVNFDGTNLTGADFAGSSFADPPEFRCAYMKGSDFSFTWMSNGLFYCDQPGRVTNLEYTKWTRTFLNYADMHGADLRFAKMRDAEALGVNMTRADLSGAVLDRVDFGYADMAAANMSHADLSESNIDDANLQNADLSHSNLSYVLLYGSIADGADLSYTNLSPSNLVYVSLHSANLTGAVLTNAALYYANLQSADITNSVLTGAYFCHTVMPDGATNNTNC